MALQVGGPFLFGLQPGLTLVMQGALLQPRHRLSTALSFFGPPRGLQEGRPRTSERAR
jgi:hypothetical protein